MKYWLINPKNEGSGTDLSNIDINYVTMGWEPKDSPKFYQEVHSNDIIIVASKAHYNNICHYWGLAKKLDTEERCWYLTNPTIELCNEFSNIIRSNPTDFSGGNSKNPWGGTARSIIEIGNNESSNKIKALISNYLQRNNMNSYKNLLLSTNNLILTGAPGTGKTYLAKQIAQQIIFGEIKEQMTDSEQIQFKEQCGFVQFHPSYDYTDFVEGLRPKQDDNGNIGFERKDGVFKEFCAKALINSQYADLPFADKRINSNSVVWKVSLAGTGDNPIRKYCMENGCIRIGWKKYGNVEDFDEFEDWTDGGKNILRAFQNKMKEGDIVVSCYTAKEIDAIGVITGEYEYNDQFTEYPRLRKVEWLVKNIKEDIVEMNGCKFTLPAVYRSNITIEDALKIVRKYTHKTSSNIENDKPFVFIIDEINRGEISKIFGELFYSIDPGYRGENGRVQTQYQNIVEDGNIFKKGFFVPRNVYIIGTMNDIDRSVESMDFAFRRRFAFKEISAEDSKKMLDSADAWGKDDDNISKKPEQKIIDIIKRKMDAVNNVIWHEPKDNENEEIQCIEGLSSAYHIGASYFLKLANYRGADKTYNDESFKKLWDLHLNGLLHEYLRGTQEAESQLKKLEEAYNGSNSNNG